MLELLISGFNVASFQAHKLEATTLHKKVFSVSIVSLLWLHSRSRHLRRQQAAVAMRPAPAGPALCEA